MTGVNIGVVGFVATQEEFCEIRRRAEACGATSAIARLDSSGDIIVEFRMPAPKFERIRRITGYLVGTTDRFNDAKRAEERDRVRHEINLSGGSNERS